jgi:hypothetical protein
MRRLRALPSCFGFNRLERFLHLHSSPVGDLTCSRGSSEPNAALVVRSYAPGESLGLWRNSSRADCEEAECTSYKSGEHCGTASRLLIAHSCHTSRIDETGARVEKQLITLNGGISVRRRKHSTCLLTADCRLQSAA